MATITTTAGGTNATTGTSSNIGRNSTTQGYNPTLPGGILGLINRGVDLSQSAADRTPYDGLTQNAAGFNNDQWTSVAPGLRGIAAYQPQQVNSGNVTRFAGGSGIGGLSTAGLDFSGYTNPYTDGVIDSSLRDIRRQTAITQQQNNGQAARAGAFGGDRAAIVNTETQRNADDQAARTIAALRSQNFDQARTAANTDISRQLQAGTTQSTQDLQAAQGNQYAGLQGQNLNLSATGAYSGLLDKDQATRQRFFDNQYKTDLDRALYPQRNAEWLLGQAQKLPYGALTSTASNSTTDTRQDGSQTGTGTNTGSKVEPGPSTIGQLGGLVNAGVGIIGAAGGFNGAFGSAVNGAKGIYEAGKGLVSYAAPDAGSAFDGPGTASLDPGVADFFGSDLSSFGGSGTNIFDVGGFFARGGTVDDFGADHAPINAPVARNGIAAYADGGVVDPMGYTPSMQSDEAGDAKDAARRRSMIFGAMDDATALMNDERTPVGSVDDAVQMAAARAAREQRMSPPQAQQFHDELRATMRLPSRDQAVPQGIAAVARPQGTSVNPVDPEVPTGIALAATRPGAADNAVQVDAASYAQAGEENVPDENMSAVTVPDRSIPEPPIPPPMRPVPAGVTAGVTTQPMPGRVERMAPQFQQPARREVPERAGVDPLWTALIRAGGAMMASKQHTGLGALGEGAVAGVDGYTQGVQQQQRNEIARTNAENLREYRGNTAATGAMRVANGARAIDERGRHNEVVEQGASDKLAETARRNDAYIANSFAKAQRVPGLTRAQLDETVARDLMTQNPSMTFADAMGQVRGRDLQQARVDQGDRRLDATDQRRDAATSRDAANQDYRQQQVQLRATTAEDGAARSIINAAAQLGKNVTYESAIQQVRSTRQSAGPAPVPPSGLAAIRGAAGAPGGGQAGADPISRARDAINRGAPRDAVIRRLTEAGYDAAGL